MTASSQAQPLELTDDFEPDIDLTQWSAFGGTVGSTILATNYGGSGAGANSLWFGAVESRSATTRAADTTLGGTIGFFLRISDGDGLGTWERAELPEEGVVLEYSTDLGSNWVTVATYDTPSYTQWTYVFMPVPIAARGPSALFRWRQLSHGGSVGDNRYDHWALDEVEILGPEFERPPVLMSQPTSQSVFAQAAVSLLIGANGSWPLVYQWQFNGTNLPGATEAILTLSSVTTEQAGVYSVVVSNTFGSVESSNVTLSVFPVMPLAQAVDNTNLVWSHGGSAPWFGQTNLTHDGQDAARSGEIQYGQTSWMETTVSGPGTLSFWWRVSSEADYDYLFFYTNGVECASLSGEVDWEQLTHQMPAGSHVLRWQYSKDDRVSNGQDAAWVDEVHFTPSPVVEPQRISSLISNGTLVLQWAEAEWRLQSRTNLQSGQWTESVLTPVMQGDMYRVEVPYTEANEYFRLIAP